MNIKYKNLLIKIALLFIILCIPLLALTSCGAPASNKYLTLVSEFNNLLRYPNPSNEQETIDKDKTIKVHYSLLARAGQSNVNKWSFVVNNATSTDQNQPLTSDKIDNSFLNIYGTLVNTIAYNIAYPASVFATTVSSYNRSLGDDKNPNIINLFKDDKNNFIPNNSDFYKGMSNNLLVANNENNINFGISDLTFNFKKINSSGAVDNTGVNNGIIDARKNGTYDNSGKEITDNASDMTKNNVNNRLSKMYAITDIAVYFRYYIAGSDQGSVSPSRNQIVVSNPTDDIGKKNKEILDNQFQKIFNKKPESYTYKLSMNDMVAILLYGATDIKKDEQDPNKLNYKITPSIVQSLTPLSWLTNESFTLVNGDPNNPQKNLFKIDNDLLNNLIDPSKILTERQFEDKGLTIEQQRTQTFLGRTNAIDLQSRAFISEINVKNIAVSELKKQILKIDNNQNNLLNFTIEDYYSQYFKSLISDDNFAPFVEDITLPTS
ncbi:hypothetical protein [Mycoplasmoides pirum]|uniref:hypothetical protein n=1 Tax=Mycoplasmoides pirum TaxID=2122 RepID=UPI00048976D3|nr:hypothetical protein [Mycoplasmoides pirum]